MRQTVSVVVPVFNNAPTLEDTCRQIVDIHESSFKDLDLEVVFVNDGSTDKSWEELLRLKDRYEGKVSLLNLSRNFGQVAASLAGFDHARGDAVICISADLQDPIALMGKMVAYWRNQTEIVICYREDRKDGLLPQIFSNVAYSIARISCSDLPKGGFDYWLMSRKVCQLLRSVEGRHNFLQIYLLSLGFSKAFIPYTRAPRSVGRSSYKFAEKLKIAIDCLVDSYLPIRLMTCLGAFVLLCAIVYSLLIAYASLIHATPFTGWAPIMIVSMMTGGVVMIMLGLIGEYIWRIYDNQKRFPFFIVETKSIAGRDESPE